ncbi:PREDICTED: protein SUPPRESSOR OF GENE SILENCING 3-like [Brassica oleracea var. oleracea]|uniref:protein SUPPRESSOR OF GENE SILENCING 3-like n=1 Tax=Brassica oleracea var. oleracea TaxID=109376 RepID=UPI0006A726A7|nr:PREDICTED: protein SUPPRESSOR OF GENE SILENCING 3-like [Brassica oleracea var. oleracea]
MRLYQEVRELSQITEDNRQLYWFKKKQTKQNKHAKELEESLGILRHSMKMQHAQNREEMDYMTVFPKLKTDKCMLKETQRNIISRGSNSRSMLKLLIKARGLRSSLAS